MFKSLKILLFPFYFIYIIIIKIRNLFFDIGIFTSEKIDSFIISIGNLTLGGSGKTPAVLLVTNLLKENNINVGVLSRGYRRKSRGFLLVSDDDKNLIAEVDKAGDETYLIADELRIPTAVCEKRVEGAKKLIGKFKLGAVVLDDAYQHRWINRDLNILMFDQRFLTQASPLDRLQLPIGLMRESFSSVNRADMIIINRKFTDKIELEKKYVDLFTNKKLFYGYYKVKGLYDVKTHHFYEMSEFIGQKSLVVCGIAKPYSFFNTLKNNSIDITNKMIFTDHMHYSMKEVEKIRKRFYDSNSYSVITTHKDAVKLANYSKELDDIDIYYLKIEMEIEDRSNFNKYILESIVNENAKSN